jgi:hypothetical protein
MKINKGSPLKIIFLTIIVLAGIYFFQQSTKEGLIEGFGIGTLPPKKMKMGGIGTLPPKKMKPINNPSSNKMRFSRM